MKKILLLFVTLSITLLANAQVSIQVGYLSNQPKITVETGSELGRMKLQSRYRGITAAVDYNVHFTDYLGVAPGVGIDYSFLNQDGIRYNELGLFAPVDVNYCLPVSDNLSLSLFAGPTLYYGLFSREKIGNETYDYYAENYSKRFDVSLGGGFWLDIMENIRVKIGYKFGLTDTSKIKDTKERNNFLSISVGYVF